MIDWLKSFLNEPGTNEGSSQRLMMTLLVVTVLSWLTFLVILKQTLPEVPSTLQTLVEYLGTTLILGIGFGKGIAAYRAVKTPSTASTDQPAADRPAGAQ